MIRPVLLIQTIAQLNNLLLIMATGRQENVPPGRGGGEGGKV